MAAELKWSVVREAFTHTTTITMSEDVAGLVKSILLGKGCPMEDAETLHLIGGSMHEAERDAEGDERAALRQYNERCFGVRS